MKNTLKELGLTPVLLKRIIQGRRFKPKIIEKNISNKTFKFAIVSDTHFGSKLAKINELHTFYEICRKDGIDTIIHAGDIVDGNRVFFGHETELDVWGAANQAKFAIENYPKIKGIKTYFITGNHCLSFFKQNGIDVGELITQKREDLVYCGQFIGNISINGVNIRFIHPDGYAYAISYKSQKIAEQIPSGEKPHIICFGHWHQALYFFYRNMHIINCGAFQGQSQFLLRKGVNPAIGGWTIKVRVADDKKKTILAFTPTFVPFIGGIE